MKVTGLPCEMLSLTPATYNSIFTIIPIYSNCSVRKFTSHDTAFQGVTLQSDVGRRIKHANTGYGRSVVVIKHMG